VTAPIPRQPAQGARIGWCSRSTEEQVFASFSRLGRASTRSGLMFSTAMGEAAQASSRARGVRSQRERRGCSGWLWRGPQGWQVHTLQAGGNGCSSGHVPLIGLGQYLQAVLAGRLSEATGKRGSGCRPAARSLRRELVGSCKASGKMFVQPLACLAGPGDWRSTQLMRPIRTAAELGWRTGRPQARGSNSSCSRGHPDGRDPALEPSSRRAPRLHHRRARSAEGPDHRPVPRSGGPVPHRQSSRSARVLRPPAIGFQREPRKRQDRKMTGEHTEAANAGSIGSSPADSPPGDAPGLFGAATPTRIRIQPERKAGAYLETNGSIVREPCLAADQLQRLWATGGYRYASSTDVFQLQVQPIVQAASHRQPGDSR